MVFGEAAGKLSDGFFFAIPLTRAATTLRELYFH